MPSLLIGQQIMYEFFITPSDAQSPHTLCSSEHIAYLTLGFNTSNFKEEIFSPTQQFIKTVPPSERGSHSNN